MFDWLIELFDAYGNRQRLPELAARLELPLDELKRCPVSYHEFKIAKRSGGSRAIAAPDPQLKKLQRRILRRLLAALKTHPSATGFQRGVSFVENAAVHQSQSIVIRLDLVNFFPSIQAERIHRYFRVIGWDRKSAKLLTRLLTWRGCLPQGAPTSPRLSNLVCNALDYRLANFAKNYHGVYTRYADDITISLSDPSWDLAPLISGLLHIVRSSGFTPHIRDKFDVRRRHQRQKVTGLVVNDRANLPRETRRWLRAVRHRFAGQGSLGKRPTISREQFEGWLALEKMIANKRD